MEIVQSFRQGDASSIVLTIQDGTIEMATVYRSYCRRIVYRKPEKEKIVEIFNQLLLLDPNSLVNLLKELSDQELKELGKEIICNYLKEVIEKVKEI